MKKQSLNLLYRSLVGCLVMVGLGACNGGGGSSSSSAPTPTLTTFTNAIQDQGKECDTNGVVVDASGNLYTNTNCRDLNSGIVDYTLTKYSSVGTEIFSRSLVMNPTGTSNPRVEYSHATGIALDADNNIYVSSFSELPDIVTPPPYAQPQVAGVVYKYNATGKLLWKHDFSNNDYMIRANAITVDKEGNPIVVGEMINRDAVLTTVTPYFVTKLDKTDGRQLFYVAQAINDGENSADSVVVDNSNNIFIYGKSPVKPTSGSSDILYNGYLVAKYDSNGQSQWLQQKFATEDSGIGIFGGGQIATDGSDV